MALHKTIEYASDDDCEIDNYEALPVHEVDDDFDTAREMFFEDHDVLNLFNKSIDNFWLGQVDSANDTIERECTHRVIRAVGALACPKQPCSLPNAHPRPEQAAVEIMGAANLHPSDWFLAFKPDRAADHVRPPPPRRAGLRPAVRRMAAAARAPEDEGAPRRRRAPPASEERAPLPAAPAPPKRRRAAAP